MSSQSSGRRRSNMRQYSAEDQALNMISKEAEARLAAKRASRAEAREIRLKEMEKQQKESEAKQDRVYELTNEHATAKIRQQLSGSNSRRGSAESNDSDTKETDFKAELRELEEKYRTAMMTSAQLDNEKQSLIYQVELLKDQLEEQDEGFTQVQREHRDKCRDYDFQKRDLKSLQHDMSILKQQLEIKDRLIEDSGFVIVSNDNGEPVFEKSTQHTSGNGPLPASGGAVLVSVETRNFLEKATGITLDDKIKSFALEREALRREIKTLKTEIEDHQFNATKGEHSSNAHQMNGPEMQLYEIQREASKQIHDYKFKLQKAEQDIATLEGMVTRLDSQVKRYKSDAERAEGMEDELKQEKRKLQKELREALTQIEELQNQNKNLTARLERIKQTRTALGIQ